MDNEIAVAEIKRESTSALAEACRLSSLIKDNESYEQACTFRMEMNRLKKAALERLDPVRKKAYTAYKETLKLIDDITTPYDEAMQVVDAPIKSYADEMERRKRVEEERLRKEAQRQAEEAQLAAAEEAQKSGEHERADAILDQTPLVAVPVVEAAPKVDGMSFRELWKIDLPINMNLLVKAIAAGKADLGLVSPNMIALNGVARALKDRLNIPGVKVIREKVISSRTR
jgi:hypothetical protein